MINLYCRIKCLHRSINSRSYWGGILSQPSQLSRSRIRSVVRYWKSWLSGREEWRRSRGRWVRRGIGLRSRRRRRGLRMRSRGLIGWGVIKRSRGGRRKSWRTELQRKRRRRKLKKEKSYLWSSNKIEKSNLGNGERGRKGCSWFKRHRGSLVRLALASNLRVRTAIYKWATKAT